MKSLLRLTMLVLAVAVPDLAHAAGADEYGKLNSKAKSECFKHSDLAKPELIVEPSDFEDNVLVLMRGYPTDVNDDNPDNYDKTIRARACEFGKKSLEAVVNDLGELKKFRLK